jgi:hypothetical protein
MRHPALRRSARHASKREAKSGMGTAAQTPSHDPSAQNPGNPNAPADGDHNQGGSRAEGLDYQRDLGSEQDA